MQVSTRRQEHQPPESMPTPLDRMGVIRSDKIAAKARRLDAKRFEPILLFPLTVARPRNLTGSKKQEGDG